MLATLGLGLSVGHCLAWEGADEVEEEVEKEEEHAKDGTNDELVNPAVDNGMRHDGGCGRHRAAAVAAIAAIAVHQATWCSPTRSRYIAARTLD
jgi:hypothetical protein